MVLSDETLAEFMEHLRRAIHVFCPEGAKAYTRESLAAHGHWNAGQSVRSYQMGRILDLVGAMPCTVCAKVADYDSCREGWHPGHCWRPYDENNPVRCSLCGRPRLLTSEGTEWEDWERHLPHEAVCPECLARVEAENPEPMEAVWKLVEANCFTKTPESAEGA